MNKSIYPLRKYVIYYRNRDINYFYSSFCRSTITFTSELEDAVCLNMSTARWQKEKLLSNGLKVVSYKRALELYKQNKEVFKKDGRAFSMKSISTMW